MFQPDGAGRRLCSRTLPLGVAGPGTPWIPLVHTLFYTLFYTLFHTLFYTLFYTLFHTVMPWM
jgi:hypothetical protein